MRRVPITTPEPATVAEPLSASEFDAAMAAFKALSAQGIAIAVSGGPDSMALAYCLKRWVEQDHPPLVPRMGKGANALARSGWGNNIDPSPAKTKGLAEAKPKFSLPPPQGWRNLRAFIVDHSLRANSGTEAEETKKQLEALNIPTDILRWEHGPVASKLHITARRARYALLLDACRRYGMTDLMLAHQREDQAETILMRFAKGSGIDGLAGIAAESRMDDIRLLRPLLHFPKQRLIATCEAANISYIVDASNLSDKFARGRLRRVMPLLADEGLTQERLCDLGSRAAEARDALNHYMNQFLQTSVVQDEAGVIRIDLAAFRALPNAVAGRVITHALQTVHREDYAPEHASLAGLVDAIRNNKDMSPRTLHGCMVSVTAAQLIIMREYAAISDAPTIRPGENVLWDGRWQVTLSKDAPAAYTIRPLGNPPHDVLDRLAPGLRHKIAQGRARASLPALWSGEKPAENLALIPALTTSSGSSPTYAQVLALPRTSP